MMLGKGHSKEDFSDVVDDFLLGKVKQQRRFDFV